MTNTMKIYENGKLVEVVKRPMMLDFHKPSKQIITIRPKAKSRLKTRKVRNGWGSNQYQTKSRNDWRKTLFAGIIILLLVGGIFRGIKVFWDVKVDPAIKAFAKEKEAGESGKLISPIPDPTVMPSVSPTPEKPTIEDIKEDRIKKTYSFLSENKSPLADHAELIVTLADKHDIPWTLITAIAGKESSFGKNIKANSFNAWGIMAWDKNGVRYIRSFDSWESGIEYATKLISENYRHNMNKAIQVKYCPSFECSDTWVNDVTGFQEAINE